MRRDDAISALQVLPGRESHGENDRTDYDRLALGVDGRDDLVQRAGRFVFLRVAFSLCRLDHCSTGGAASGSEEIVDLVAFFVIGKDVLRPWC